LFRYFSNFQLLIISVQSCPAISKHRVCGTYSRPTVCDLFAPEKGAEGRGIEIGNRVWPHSSIQG
jgi:hypothetical protein